MFQDCDMPRPLQRPSPFEFEHPVMELGPPDVLPTGWLHANVMWSRPIAPIILLHSVVTDAPHFTPFIVDLSFQSQWLLPIFSPYVSGVRHGMGHASHIMAFLHVALVLVHVLVHCADGVQPPALRHTPMCSISLLMVVRVPVTMLCFLASSIYSFSFRACF